MTALQPYSGAYSVGPQVWVTAHTTQFSVPGYNYLRTGAGPGTGSGLLAAGGSYVTLQSPDGADFSIIVEKMSHDHSTCVRPGLPAYNTAPEVATFKLAGSMAGVTSLHLWYTHLAFGVGDTQVEFQYMGTLPVVGGLVTLNVTVDSLYTLTTLPAGVKGNYSSPPTPTLFPPVYTDNYEACAVSSEPNYWTDMNGAFECQPSADPAHGIVLTQMTPLRPITWGSDTIPHSLWAGGRDFVNVSYIHDVFLPNEASAAFLGARCQGEDDPNGVLWAVNAFGDWNVTFSISALMATSGAVATGTLAYYGPGEWHTFRLDVNGSVANGWVDGIPAFTNLDVSGAPQSGHVGE